MELFIYNILIISKGDNLMQRSTLTVPEVARYLGVSTDTIYTMVKRKQIPHVRVRRRILFRIESIDEWMRKQEALANQEGEVLGL